MTDVTDGGLQIERTELAWGRTALALALGSIVAMRTLPHVFDDGRWALAGITGILVATFFAIAGRSRSRLLSTSAARRSGGALLLSLAAVAAAIGLAAGGVVVAVHAG